MLDDPLIVVAQLAHIFDDMGVAYLVGGSFASSLYGIPRATQDVDIMADLGILHAKPLATLLEKEFYVDSESIADAIRRRQSFNVIHLDTMFKADIFLPQHGAWSREEIVRVRTEQLQVAQETLTIRFSSPEGAILHKLLWYRLGGDISDRQWNDVLGILRIQGAALDFAYLERWAATLDLMELLLRARTAESST